MKLIVVILFCLVINIVAVSVTDRCTSANVANANSNCPTWETPYKYCSLTTGKQEGKCLDKTDVPLDGTTKFSTSSTTAINTEKCADGFRYMGQNGDSEASVANRQCQRIAMIGCTVEDEDADNNGNSKTTCFRNSNFQNAGNGQKCTRTGNTFGIAVEGKTCDITKDNDRQICGHNTVCTTNNVCRRQNDIGGSCGTQFDTCLSGLICHKWTCIAPYSLSLGTPCDRVGDGENFGCQTGYCGTSHTCEHTETQQPCYRNIDCKGTTNSVCIGADPSTDKKGSCSAAFQLARANYYTCAYKFCGQHVTDDYSQETAETCLTTGTESNAFCSKEYARYMCSKYCAMDPDRRQSGLHLSDETWIANGEIPYKFNCKELKVSKLTNTDCAITSFFDGCEAFKDYPSSGSMLTASASLMIAMIFLFFF